MASASRNPSGAEPFRGSYAGWWSRRIDETNRIVYSVKTGDLIIAACRGHYDD